MIGRSLFFGVAIALFQNVGAQLPLAPISAATDLDLRFEYAAAGNESRCGPDLFILERGFWKCARKGADGKFKVFKFGKLSLPTIDGVVRGPIADDRRLYIASGDAYPVGLDVHALDPVTLAVQRIGALPEGSFPAFPATHVDADGDGIQELIIVGPMPIGRRIVRMQPGGIPQSFAVVSDISFYAFLSGQFDADSRTELGRIAGGTLSFFDPLGMTQEPYQAPGNYADSRLPWTGDWDADGIDEIAVGDCCSIQTVLLDPDTFSQPRSISLGNAPSQALALVDWSGPNSRDLLVFSQTRFGIFNPRTATSINEYAVPPPFFLFGAASFPLTRDWDGDNDTDVLVRVAESNAIALWMIRNPQGLEAVQRSAGVKIPIGVDSEDRVVAVEEFDAITGVNLHIRARDRVDLALLSEFVVEAGNGWLDRRHPPYPLVDQFPWSTASRAPHGRPGAATGRSLERRLHPLPGPNYWTELAQH